MTSQENSPFLEEMTYEVLEQTWQLRLKASAIGNQNLERLPLLDLHHPAFLKQSTRLDEEGVCFTYDLPDLWLSLAEVKRRPMSDQLRLALNSLDLEACLSLPVTFFLAPAHTLITKDLHLKLAYRGLPEVMVPKQMDEQEFLKQAKSYILSIFTDYSFNELYQGSLPVVEVAPFLDELRQLETISDMRDYLKKLYLEKLMQESRELSLVKSRTYKLHRYATIWLSVLSAVLVVPLVYLTFFQLPFKERLLEADTAFLKVNYTAVIDQLKPVKLKDLPYSQKYALAYSYIKSSGFSEDKEKVILNNVSLKTEELYLDYWIALGRGDNEAGLDMAKRLNDSDLILYALAKEMDQVRSNTSLSGAEREETLSSLQSSYDKYWKERQEALTDAEGNAVTDQASEPSETSTSPASSESAPATSSSPAS